MNLSVVEYTTDRAAEVLGIHEAQVRILAQRNNISAPFSGDELEVLRNSLDKDTAPDNAIAESHHTPAAVTTDNGLSPAMLGFCDELEGEIVTRLTAEMSSRMPRIKGAIVDNLLPQ
ncbi:MAG TPA: hypothetical protein V6D20_05350 [Candidatus Obscuribacterales bacterium]